MKRQGAKYIQRRAGKTRRRRGHGSALPAAAAHHNTETCNTRIYICQDVTVPVRDTVAIIFASTLSPPSDFKPMTLLLKGPASAEQRFNVGEVFFPAPPAQGNVQPSLKEPDLLMVRVFSSSDMQEFLSRLSVQGSKETS
ncbi:hypothetical protein EYF80_030832 [Liparis tanakae]|uniref:Uncharacterized protein n=1 Tax=Liparis tanakae TaxID=230148 RepID=A0A4Z2GZK3_9TELE|nr:hypothetical protein EYF80_030832 [Liparis tanakae]